MRRTEQGYSLLTTLLVVTVFFLLGLTIIAVSLQHARFATVRVDDVQSLHKAKTEVNEAVADLKAELSDPNFFTSHHIFSPNEWDHFLGLDRSNPGKNTMTGRLLERYGVMVKDESDQYQIDKQQVFLRVLRLEKSFDDGHRTRTVVRRVFVTNTPSFLKYALGSNRAVVLNGGVYIEKGDVYAGETGYASNATTYVSRTNELKIETYDSGMPRFSNSSVWYLNGAFQACGQTKSCWKVDETQTRFQMTNQWESSWPGGTTEPPPSFQPSNEDFVDVDFELTVADKLLQAAGFSPSSPEYIAKVEAVQEAADKTEALRQLANNLKDRFNELNGNDPLEIIKQKKDKPLYVNGDINLIGDVDIRTDKGVNQWLIVNGPLNLNGPQNDFINIHGNFIVFGDLTITGNVKLDASVYVTGKTKIYQSRIERADNGKGVVLLSKGKLDLARINEFDNPRGEANLKGYFYTDSSATIYAVGSYLYIDGGLFARGNGDPAPDTDIYGLVVNAFRGRVEGSNGEPSGFVPNPDVALSRLVVRYRPEVLVEQGTGLPFVNRLSLVVDRLEVR
ncbi:hypothetical protein [Geobacillus sp. C56-T2]|uniref:hypothetical protein n=1 Tax=Geobacillus sp. C56-T2 TaxID=600773 RepID=UPI0011A6251A|nr:hypothetical protein [Geobacillus sp. C56-T2]NNV05545.1 hypothetical protein [Geobacillus sp. MMMUD3]TWG31398.1 hypothetical protein GC56T2_2612 [Geobacillus sp. C56-T2]